MEKLYKKMNNYMKKIPNFAWITIIIITTALMFCTILTSVDSTLIWMIIILIVGAIIIFINNHIPKKAKNILLVILIIVLCWIISHNFYLKITYFVSLLLSGIVLSIISKNIYKFLKITLVTIQILIMCWTGVVLADMNRMVNLKEPMFAKITNKDGDVHTYKGFGYKVQLKYGDGHFFDENSKKVIVEGTFYIFNNQVVFVII